MVRHRRRLRWTISLVAVLLVPGGLLSAWAWLYFGGSIEEQARGEREEAGDTLDEVAAELEQVLASVPPQDPGAFVLALDGAGRPARPFRLAPVSGPSADPGLALDTAMALLARGQAEEALPFFEKAAENGAVVAPPGVLAWARCLHQLARSDEALALLADTVDAQAEAWVDGLPLPTLRVLLELRIHRDLGDDDGVRSLEQSIVGGALSMPPGAAPAVVELLSGTDARDREDFLRAARVAGSLSLPPGEGPPRPGPGGSVLVPREGSVLVLAPWRVDQLVQSAAEVPGSAWLRVGTELEGDLLASRVVESLGVPLYAVAEAELASQRTASIARLLALAALGSFVLGNLLLFAVARSELALSRMRSNFIDVVSHELRTPLTSLMLKAEMLAGGHVLPERVVDYQRSLHGEAEKLGILVQRVLDFARLQKARLPLEPARVPARSLLADALRAGRDNLRKVGQHLRVEAPRDLPDVWVDREVMARAFRNLLENASRYAPPGSLVEVRAGTRGRRLHLWVADRGPGLGGGDTRPLFEPFRRGADSGGPGSGLGLAIVKQAVQAHGGSVSAGNRDGGGAEFHIDLPLARKAS